MNTCTFNKLFCTTSCFFFGKHSREIFSRMNFALEKYSFICMKIHESSQLSVRRKLARKCMDNVQNIRIAPKNVSNFKHLISESDFYPHITQNLIIDAVDYRLDLTLGKVKIIIISYQEFHDSNEKTG